MSRFPYPLKSKSITIYGKEYCEYCQKIKKYLKNKYKDDYDKKVKYYDIDKLNFADFQEKMKPFIQDYNTIPLVFLFGDFIGGYDDLLLILKKMNIPYNTLKSNQILNIEKSINRIMKKLKA